MKRSEMFLESNDNELAFDPKKAKINYSNHKRLKVQTSTDISIDELNEVSALIDCNRSIDSIESVCKKCEANTKKQFFYIQQISRLKKINKILKERAKKSLKFRNILAIKLRRLKKDKAQLREYQKQTIEEKIDFLHDINKNWKTFCKLILSQGKRQFTQEERWICQCIFFRSSSGYNFLRDQLQLHLPHPASLHRWIKLKSLSPGLNENVFEEIQKNVLTLEPKDKEVILIFDEMSIQANLTYNKYKDIIEGFVDYGENQRLDLCAKSVCVFMIRGICGKYKQVLYHVTCPSNIPTKQLEIEVYNCIDICRNLGLNVRGICCDQGPTNRNLFNKLKLDEDNSSFLYKEKKSVWNV